MRLGTRSLLGTFALATVFAVAACKPTYPKCESDDHCKEKGEVCLNGQCQECREDAQCVAKHGEGFECQSGRCDAKPECRADGDCTKVGAGLVCRSQKCVPECAQNEDCPAGKKCESQKCVAECAVDIDCGPNRICNAGVCQDKAADGTKVSSACRPMDAAAGDIIATPLVHFDFDQYELTVDARSELDRAADCMKQAPEVRVVIEGHADDRGTQEYNLALGDKRAATVKQYLHNLGIDTSRLSTRSKGENEPICHEESDGCWAQNRRVLFLQSRK